MVFDDLSTWIKSSLDSENSPVISISWGGWQGSELANGSGAFVGACESGQIVILPEGDRGTL